MRGESRGLRYRLSECGRGRWCAGAHNSAGGAGRRVRAGGCGLPELDPEGEELVQEVGADEVPWLVAILFRQKAALVLGRVAWNGQPCQK